jgi:hypothetical protein
MASHAWALAPTPELTTTLVADRPCASAYEISGAEWTSSAITGVSWLGRSDVCHAIFAGRMGGFNDWQCRLERVVKELGRLRSDDAQDFLAPTDSHLTELETALGVLPADTRDPEVEVDGSDASITVRWWTDDRASAFAITFPGNGRAYGTASSVQEAPPHSWCFRVSDETKILDGIEHSVIRKAMTGRA